MNRDSFQHFKKEIATRLIREGKIPLEQVNEEATKLAAALAEEPEAEKPESPTSS